MDAMDDILGQICDRMKEMSTTSKEDKLSALISVLQLENSVAEFFLESAAWDLEKAVALYLDNNSSRPVFAPSGTLETVFQDNGSSGKRRRKRESSHEQESSPAASYQRWHDRPVPINDLPEDWECRIKPDTGKLYFLHRPTGVTQREVPPGYADASEDFSTEFSRSDGNLLDAECMALSGQGLVASDEHMSTESTAHDLKPEAGGEEPAAATAETESRGTSHS